MGKNTKFSKKLMSQMSLDPNNNHRTPFERDEYNLLNAIDRPRDDAVAYNFIRHPRLDLSTSKGPTTSTVSLNNCEESLTTSDSGLSQNGQQSLDSQEHGHTEGGSGRTKYRADSQPSQLGDSYQLIRISSARKAKTKSFTFSTTNESYKTTT